MAYHVTILRTHQGKADPIGSEEMRELVERMHSAKIEPCSLNDGELDLVIARGEGRSYRFVLQHGRIWTKNPEDDEIQVMIDVATELNARVRGDEFETFRTPTETYIHPDDRLSLENANAAALQLRRAARRRQWALHLVLVLIFAALAATAAYFSH